MLLNSELWTGLDLAFAERLRGPEGLVGSIAVAVVAVAVTALAGWQVGSVQLTSVVVGAVALQPPTAVALIVGAAGLAAAAAGYVWLSRLAGATLLAACLVWLAAYATRSAVPADLLLFRDAVLHQQPAPLWPGRPSIITCLVTALFAASLLGVPIRRPSVRLAAVGAASLGGLIASFSVLPFVLQAPSQLAILGENLRIALNTTVAVGALCGGVLILMRDTGWVRLVAGGGERGRIARLLAPVAVVPIAFGTLANIGVRIGLYGPDVRMLLIIVLSVCTLLVLAFWAAQRLGRERGEREAMARALDNTSVIVCDPQARISHWPSACERLYGWSAREVLGKDAGDLFSIEAPERRAAIRTLLQRNGEWRGELRQRTKSGEIRWFANHWTIEDGGPDGGSRMVGTINDITDLKLAEASLRDSQERLTLAVNAYDIGIADADMVSRTLVAEEGFERMLGVPPGGLQGDIGKLNAMIVSADPDRDAGIAARQPLQMDEVSMRRPDGEVRDFHGVRRFFYSPEGAHVRTIGIYRDVTDERRAQRELAQRGDRLAELRSELNHVARLSAMGEMAAALAHELNQPLTAIGNSVGALKIILGDGGKVLDDTARSRVVRAASQAESQAVRAGEIVRRLRDFIARGEADARIEPLAPLIEDSLALGAPDARAEELEVRLELSPKADRVLADRIQIQQILVNLIRNAGEAMRDSPAPHILTISTTVKRGMVEVSVRDTGPGVSPELAKRLFSPFLSTKTTGMGVGLSICRRIVEAHGGSMWLEETYGAGADFRFTVPLAAMERRHA
jgi:two-component system sensor kinase FixL